MMSTYRSDKYRYRKRHIPTKEIIVIYQSHCKTNQYDTRTDYQQNYGCCVINLKYSKCLIVYENDNETFPNFKYFHQDCLNFQVNR